MPQHHHLSANTQHAPRRRPLVRRLGLRLPGLVLAAALFAAPACESNGTKACPTGAECPSGLCDITTLNP